LLAKHAADEVVTDHGIDAVVEFYGGGFPAAELTTVVGLLDEIAGDE
jgi:hypothetical protein